MKNNSKNTLTKQIRIPLLGEFRQLVGGAMTWFTFGTFAFAGMAAWDSEVVMVIRRLLPWLTFHVACILIVAAALLAVWVEHKFTQPSIMVYWLKMFWEQRNPMRTFLESKMKSIEERQDSIEMLLKTLLDREVDESNKQ